MIASLTCYSFCSITLLASDDPIIFKTAHEKISGLSFSQQKKDSMTDILTDRLKTYNYLRSQNLTLPNGILPNGMPASITFVGKHFGEADLLAFANAYQQQTGFQLKHPSGFLP
jgi:Asp-tRNA(Asn)/Glu-tRNA(Gln) amidotransferase A subunit family amidase